MMWIIHISILGLLSYLGFKFIKIDTSPFIYWAALISKITAGLVLGYIFIAYYGSGDTLSFFEAATKTTYSDSEPRTYFFVSVIRPIVSMTGGSYWISSIWLSFISFSLCWYATVLLVRIFPNIQSIIIICLLFIPSIVFWSSGIMKGALVNSSLMLLVSIVLSFYKGYKINVINVILLISAAFILFKLKHYLFITALIFGGLLTALHLFNKLKGIWRWILPSFIILIAVVSSQFIHPYLTISRIPWTLYENNRSIRKNSIIENQLDIIIEDDSWPAVIKEFPNALHTGLLRPSIFDKTPPHGWIHKIENLIIAVLLSMSFFLYLKLKPKIDWPLFATGISCILLLATMLPLSAPNFGTLVRYKSAFLPYLFLFISILPYRYFTSSSVD